VCPASLDKPRTLRLAVAWCMTVDPISVSLSLASFVLAATTAWLTLLRPGTLKMVRPSLVAFLDQAGVDGPKIWFRSLICLMTSMRVEGSKERREAYELALQELQLEESPTGDGVKYAAEQYSVVYGGARRPLDRHLKGSNSRDRRYGFRLYFFWDEEGEVVVVGWLPSHLDNRLT